jgi:S-DNA-T family DNA segregation ATPase FtsK/SpoIIIE
MLLRGQGTYLSDDEINGVVDYVATSEPQFVQELVRLKPKDEEGCGAGPGKLKNRDDLYEAAIEVILGEGRGSVSLLQRALGIGYGRGARLIDFMAEDGIVGPYNGSQAREVLISQADWEAMRGGESEESAAPAKPKRTNKITPAADEDEEVADEEEEPPWEDDEESDEYEGDDTDEAEDEEYEADEYDEEDEYEEEEAEVKQPPKRRRGA